MGTQKVANSGRFYKLRGIHKGLKSPLYFGSVEWNIAGLASCVFQSTGLIGVEELIPRVSL